MTEAMMQVGLYSGICKEYMGTRFIDGITWMYGDRLHGYYKEQYWDADDGLYKYIYNARYVLIAEWRLGRKVGEFTF